MWYLTPVSLYDMAAMEQWLERMAQRGRFLVDAGPLLSWFEKGEPRAVRCRAEPLDTESPIPTQERLDYYESCGWHYLCTVKSFYRIFQSGDPAAEELHTDPVVLAAGMRDLEERLGMTLVYLAIFLPLLVFFELYFNQKPAEFPMPFCTPSAAASSTAGTSRRSCGCGGCGGSCWPAPGGPSPPSITAGPWPCGRRLCSCC